MSEDSITMKFRVYEVDNELNILLDSVIKLTNEFLWRKREGVWKIILLFVVLTHGDFLRMIWPLILTAFGNIFM